VEVDVAEFREFEVPLYNADLQEASGVAPGAREFGRRIAAADGLVLVSPEYNFSLPGTLKNLIDWVSRIRPVPLRGKSAVLLAASPGPFGGIRGLWQLRIPLEGLGMVVLPDMFALADAAKAFGSEGELTDPARAERLTKLLDTYLDLARRLSGSASGTM
jgi:NAD(P)H-dependent FMN reductase